MKLGFVYIMTNKYNTTFYTGVTSTIVKRVYDHKQGKGSIFTNKYKLNKLVYYEIFDTIFEAIVKEKQIKDINRKDKIKMIQEFNHDFADLYDQIKKIAL